MCQNSVYDCRSKSHHVWLLAALRVVGAAAEGAAMQTCAIEFDHQHLRTPRPPPLAAKCSWGGDSSHCSAAATRNICLAPNSSKSLTRRRCSTEPSLFPSTSASESPRRRRLHEDGNEQGMTISKEVHDACETAQEHRVSRSLLQVARPFRMHNTAYETTLAVTGSEAGGRGDFQSGDVEGGGGSSVTPSPTPLPTPSPTPSPTPWQGEPPVAISSWGSKLMLFDNDTRPAEAFIAVASQRLRALHHSASLCLRLLVQKSNPTLVFIMIAVLMLLVFLGVPFVLSWAQDYPVLDHRSNIPDFIPPRVRVRDVTIPDEGLPAKELVGISSFSSELPANEVQQHSSSLPRRSPSSAAVITKMSGRSPLAAGTAPQFGSSLTAGTTPQFAGIPKKSSKTVAAADPFAREDADTTTLLTVRSTGTSTAPPLRPQLSHLCPGLVVPRGSECLLAMPLPKGLGMPPRDRISFDVKDLQGKPVIRCETVRVDWSVSGRETMLVLRAASTVSAGPLTDGQSGALLARCEAVNEHGDRRSTNVYNHSGNLFAHIMRDPYRTCYVLTAIGGSLDDAGMPAPGQQMVFDGNFEEHAVKVTNELHEPLADTVPFSTTFDPTVPYIKLRAVSGVDVGVIICGLLSIEQMESR